MPANAIIKSEDLASSGEIPLFSYIPHAGKYNTDLAIEIALRLQENLPVYVNSWEKKNPLRVYVYKQMRKLNSAFGLEEVKIHASSVLLKSGQTLILLTPEKRDSQLTSRPVHAKLISPEDIQL